MNLKQTLQQESRGLIEAAAIAVALSLGLGFGSTPVAANAPTTPTPAVSTTTAQSFTVPAAAGSPAVEVRDSYTVTPAPVRPPAPRAAVAGTADAGSAKAIAASMIAVRGWGTGEYDCLVSLWQRESSWNVNAHNARSGAHGIPQALPGSKMASAGADWATNPATQITWGLGYITARYGTPCAAWNASQTKGWY